jgi:hypothetical protein
MQPDFVLNRTRLVVEVPACSVSPFMRVQKGRNGTLPCSAVITCPLLARLQGEKCLPFPYFNFHYRTDAFSDLDHMTFETRSGLHSHIVFVGNRSIADRTSIL